MSSKTPRTDAAKFYIGTSRKQYVEAAFAEKLEQENNALRECLIHLEDRDWFKSDMKGEVICAPCQIRPRLGASRG